MIEFSLLELREFISITEGSNFSLRDYSFISLRLALQRTCDDFKIKNFLDFVRQFQQNTEVKKTLKQRIVAHPKELLRDAGNWQYVLKSCQTIIADERKKVLILDNNSGADVVSFFLLCALQKIVVNCSVYWYSFSEMLNITDDVVFSQKDIETAQSNLQTNALNLAEYFLVNGNVYHYKLTGLLQKAEIINNEGSLLPFQIKYDLLISQNNSLKYNFAGHEHFFKSSLAAVNTNGAVFFGSRENLKQCSCFNQLLQPQRDLNYFINEDKKH